MGMFAPRKKTSFNMGYPITTQFSWDDDDEPSKFWGTGGL